MTRLTKRYLMSEWSVSGTDPLRRLDLQNTRWSEASEAVDTGKATNDHGDGDMGPRHKYQLFSETSRARKVYGYLFLPSENKLSMKVFDSITVLRNEQERQLRLGYFIIHPCSRFKLNWDVVIVLVLAVNMVVLPIELAFFPKDQTFYWVTFNLTSSFTFAIDIVVQFLSGVIEGERIHLSRAYLAKRYLRTWFVFDFLGTIPFDNITALFGQAGNTKLGKVSTILGTLKLLRLASLVRHVNQWQDTYVNSTRRSYVKLANIIVSILLLSHFNGCLLYFVPMYQDFPQGSWVRASNLLERDWFDKYVWCLFSALSQMISVGFGKVNLERTEEVILCCFVLLSGTVGFGVLLANGTAIVQSFGATKRAHAELVAEVREYMEYKRLPQPLRARIIDYFENRYRGHYFREARILNELSEVLREDLLYHSCRSLLKKVPFFVDTDPYFVCDVIKRLRNEFYQPGDVIITAGTTGSRMYFLQSGNVAIVLPDGTIVAHLKDGAHFGGDEMCLFLREKHSVSAIAEAYCVLYSLSHVDFIEVVECFPRVKEKFLQEAARRQEINRTSHAHGSTDTVTETTTSNLEETQY